MEGRFLVLRFTKSKFLVKIHKKFLVKIHKKFAFGKFHKKNGFQ